MKIVVFGADGMLGHQILATLSPGHEVVGTLREDKSRCPPQLRRQDATLVHKVNVLEFAAVAQVLRDVKPDAVVNAVGVIKQRKESSEIDALWEINAEFPRRLSEACSQSGIRMIQISTDCVFSGKQGNYKESDPPDAQDDYGKSKYAGEVVGEHALTLRTSMIGLELKRKSSLVEWFLAQSGTIKGFRRAVFSGFTTLELCRIIQMVLQDHRQKAGLYHVSSEAIDKFTLLSMLRDRLALDLRIEPDVDVVCDRSLDSSRFRREFEYDPPQWPAMIEELAVQIEERSNGI